MTAHDQMKAMLDQLMGTGRNGKYMYTSNIPSFSFAYVMDGPNGIQNGGHNYMSQRGLFGQLSFVHQKRFVCTKVTPISSVKLEHFCTGRDALFSSCIPIIFVTQLQ